MILKSFNSFIAQPTNVKPVNEAKEKFKISQARSSNPNSQGAFTVKYVGENFDMPVMVAYLQSDPISAPAMQKVKSNPERYFFVYKTLKDSQQRFLANGKVWITYLELIDAQDKDGNMLYVGFDKPPYNNFVKWSDVERLINKQDPHVVQAGKKVIGAVNNVATQEINKSAAEINNATAQAGAQTTQGQGLSDAEKSVAANAKQFMNGGNATGKPGQQPGTETIDGQTYEVSTSGNKEIDDLLNSLKGVGLGARGKKVDLLQNVIQILADANHNTAASAENKLNIRQGGAFDDIYGQHTENALKQVLGLKNMPENGIINEYIVHALKKALAAHPNIKAADLLTSNNRPTTKQPVPPAKPAAQSAKPATNTIAQAAKTGVEAQSTAPTSHEVVVPFGTIRW
jgi:hypothetical protein